METEWRCELKLTGEEASVPKLRAALRLLPEAVVTLHPTRRVQSVYLDTTYGRALEENLAGVSGREKWRWRWYGEDCERVHGALERKVRENGLGRKDVVPGEGEVRVRGAERRGFVRGLQSVLPPAWAAKLDASFEPVQWIAYRRDYLATRDGAVRLTIDRDLAAWDQRHRLRLTNARFAATRVPRLFVLELKCAPEDIEKARAIVKRLPWSVGRCSKFVLASDPGHGPFPGLEPTG